MSNNGIPPLNDWQDDEYPVTYNEGDSTLSYIKSGNKNTINTGGSSYLVYTALLSQSGTDAPVAKVLENTLGGTVVWSRNNTGDYLATLTGVFTLDKTWCIAGNNTSTDYFTVQGRNNANSVYLLVYLNGSPADDQLFDTPIEFRVYS